MFASLARLTTRFPRRVVIASLLFAAAAGAVGGPVASVLKSGGFDVPDSESQRAAASLEQATGLTADGGVVTVVRLADSPQSPAAAARVTRVAGVVAAQPHVKGVVTFFNTGDRSLLASDGSSALVVAQLEKLSDAGAAGAAAGIAKALAGEPGVTVGGAARAQDEVGTTVSQDLGRAEALAFPVLFLLSLWVFRGAVAALLPLLVGGVTIVGSFLLLRGVTTVTPISIYALNLTTGMGLGLAIDYSLFMVSRFREEMARGATVDAALLTTMRTSGRTILFSSLTVAAAMASLTVFPERFLYSMGIGGVLVALMAASVALVLLPAVLKLLGRRVDALAPRRLQRAPERDGGGVWFRLSRTVQRRPVVAALGGAIPLLLLGLPFTGIKFTSVDPSVLPASAPARQVQETLTRDYPSSTRSSVFVVLRAPASAGAEATALAQQIGSLPGADGARAVPAGSSAWRIDVGTPGAGLSTANQDLVRSIRRLHPADPMLVGGLTATFIDLQDNLASRLPLAVAIVAAATMVLLFLMTGSVVLPLKAVLMNVLTLSAAFGVLVLIFQDGRLQGLLAYRTQGALESTQPILLFAIVFGLSTDYGVFLLGRIRELHLAGMPNDEAVSHGVGRTGRIISAAALLFCVAIGAFATSQIIFIKELGVGTAAGVILDATIVRGVLVPALMQLLGGWNWWAPSFLRRLHDRVGLREEAASPGQAVATA